MELGLENLKHQPTPHPMNLRAVDRSEFGALVEPYRRELQAHCYRLLGSVQDAEDMVQETFLRAWRRRETFAGRASFRAWLYKIATNACLDALDKRPRRVVPITRQAVSTLNEPIPPAITEPIWLEPYPDDLLAADDANPEGYVVARENISLAFIAALHLLPPRQRAILILRDVLDWQANEVADLLNLTVPAVKSALHRARTTLAKYDPNVGFESLAAAALDDSTQTQLDHYVRAWEMADIGALLALLKDEATFSMPPIPSWYRGRATIGGLVAKTVFSDDASGRWRLLPTRANRQIAFGLYRHDPERGGHQAYGIQVLTFTDGLIADITTFRVPALFPYFKLPTALSS
jgi:RNA polymerase sigma-70 factor (ECF subfamily)